MVIAGRDKDQEGVVDRVYTGSNKVVAPGVNLYKKHVKKSEKMPQGGVVEVPRPIDVSKVMLRCPKCTKLTRVGYEVVKGKKSRICKQCKSKL